MPAIGDDTRPSGRLVRRSPLLAVEPTTTTPSATVGSAASSFSRASSSGLGDPEHTISW